MTPEKITQNLNPEQHNTENVNDVQPSIENDREPIIVEDVQEELKQVRDNITGEEQQKNEQSTTENNTIATIQQMINEGHIEEVIEGFQNFGLTDTEQIIGIINELIKSENGRYVAPNFDKLGLTDTKQIVGAINSLIEDGYEYSVIYNFKKFGLADTEQIIKIINSLIKRWCGVHVIRCFRNFSLDNDGKVAVINELIKDKECVRTVIYDFKKFGLADTEQIIKIINSLIENGYGWDAMLYFEKFNIEKNEIDSIFTEEVKEEMRRKKEEKYGNKSEQLFQSDELKQLIKEDEGYIILNFDKFGLTDTEQIIGIINELIKQGYTNEVMYNFEKFGLGSKGKVVIINNLINHGKGKNVAYNFQNFKLQNTTHITETIKELIIKGYGEDVVYCFNNFGLKDPKKITEIYFQLLCHYSKRELLIEDIEQFSIQPEKLYELVKNSAEFGDKITQLEKSEDLMVLLEQLKRSPSLLTVMVSDQSDKIIKAYKKHPFLPQALNANPRYGARLLYSFPSKSEQEKEKIAYLHNAKEKILKNNPDITPDSVEFRIAMQEELKSFKNNTEILKKLEQQGLNVDSWLKYNEVLNFETSENSEQQIEEKGLVEEIETIIQECTKHWKEVVENHSDKINKEAKQAINHRISTIETKWSAIQTTTKNLPNNKNKLRKCLSELNCEPFKKQGDKSLIEILKDKKLTTEQITSIITVLGNHQQDLEGLKNKLDSYKSPNSAEKKTRKLTSSYSISIASRDPDVDLYLGNYCPCCISIESNSKAISDYVTDLGMQNIVIYAHDEKSQKKIPVTVGWCYIGKKANNKDKSLYFVIDNVESNKNYFEPNHDIFAAQIRQYITSYAAQCGIDDTRIIQGDHDNDVIVLKNTSEKFQKASPYNIENKERRKKYYLDSIK